MDIVPYGGWQRCARIVSGNVEALVTLDVGPRVIRLGFVGGRNEFHENPAEMGRTGGEDYRGYGGHRLWVAPEDLVKTYQPDNDPIEATEEQGWHVFTPKVDRFGIHKQIRVRADGEGGYMLDHRVTNEGGEPVLMAPWTLTVMTTGGVCLMPQAPFAPHPDVLTPVRPIVLWSYSDTSDPRIRWGSRVVRLRQDANMGPTKLGTLITQGYAAYHNGPNLFVKRFDCEEGKEYPDMGCNFESFTRQDMLEVESLGPLRKLNPGATAFHREGWKLFGGVSLPEEQDPLGDTLANFAGRVKMG